MRRGKFVIGGLLVVAAVVYLIVTSTSAAAQYYLTIGELQARPSDFADRQVRISGAVVGESIVYDAQRLELTFTLADVPADLDDIERAGGLAEVLHRAVADPEAARLRVQYHGPRPDLLQAEAQAIVTGRLGSDGVFQADELLLKCPTRYDEELPAQSS